LKVLICKDQNVRNNRNSLTFFLNFIIDEFCRIALKRKYVSENDKRLSVLDHPLLQATKSVKVVQDVKLFFDPLSMSINDEKLNTLKIHVDIDEKVSKDSKKDTIDPWEVKKKQIISKFAYSGDVTLLSSAINDFEGSGVEDGSASRPLDKYAQRLASLEKRHVVDEKVNLTQTEYENRVKKLSNNLKLAWANDERVGSLKISIQIAKVCTMLLCYYVI
jgi:hypothetical protein